MKVELSSEQTYQNITDSQIITSLIAVELDGGKSLKEALQIIVEQKILGTYRIAAIEIENPKSVLFVKNSGDFVMGQCKEGNEIIVTSESLIFKSLSHKFNKIDIPNNHILEVNSENCEYSFEKLEKKIKVERNPKALFDHIMHEEIYSSIDAVD